MPQAYAGLIVGVLVIVLALIGWRKDRRLRAVGTRTEGVVVDLRWGSHGAYPVFRFRTHDGRVLTVEGQFGSSPPRYRAGDAVRVLYDPAHPEHARIDRAAFGPVRVAVLLAVGFLFAAIGVWLLGR